MSLLRRMAALARRLDNVALAALALLAAGVVFLLAAVRPLEQGAQRLEDRTRKEARRSSDNVLRAGSPSVRLAAFYEYFDRQESQVDWLARIYGSARASGIELRAADYRLVETEGRLARYEVSLPLSGSYAQLRAFLSQVLEQNPVVSLDQLTLRRKRVNDGAIEAEAALTIHLLRP